MYYRDIKCKIGIWFKELGCAMIHGKGQHLWRVQHDGPLGTITSCRSCGKYKEIIYKNSQPVTYDEIKTWHDAWKSGKHE